jgi:TM2 domain-containing membrane protein YozV
VTIISDKWLGSTVPTKVASVSMALGGLLALIGAILFFSVGDGELASLGALYILLFLVGALLTFGLFHLNRAARIAVIYIGLGILVPYVQLIALWILSLTQIGFLRTLVDLYVKILQFAFPLIRSVVPGDMQALAALLAMIVVGPLILYALAMIVLFAFGADFKSEPKKKSKAVAYLLWFFLGFLSAHKLYLGKDRAAVVFCITWQGFGVGWFIGLFTLGKQVNAFNAKLQLTE